MCGRLGISPQRTQRSTEGTENFVVGRDEGSKEYRTYGARRLCAPRTQGLRPGLTYVAPPALKIELAAGDGADDQEGLRARDDGVR